MAEICAGIHEHPIERLESTMVCADSYISVWPIVPTDSYVAGKLLLKAVLVRPIVPTNSSLGMVNSSY